MDCNQFYIQTTFKTLTDRIQSLEKMVNELQNPSQRCYSSVVSLIGYDVYYDPFNVGLINYYLVNIFDSFNSDRIWNFVFGGQISIPTFEIIFQFDPNCHVPNGKDEATLSEINFDNSNYPAGVEWLMGTIIVNNVMIPISRNPTILNFSWDPSTATFTYKINLIPVLPNLHWINNSDQNTIFLYTYIRDGMVYYGPTTRF